MTKIVYIKKKKLKHSPLDGHEFSRLFASPHQNTPVGAITQLPQGGVAIHRLSEARFTNQKSLQLL